MNHPIRNLRPLSAASVALMVAQAHPELLPLNRADHIPSSTLSPIEADIAREEAEEKAKRTATPEEVFITLRDNTEHRRQDMNQIGFSKWLQDREWPEEQSQRVSKNGMTWTMKLFKAHDGFAVKWVPIVDGKVQPTRAAYEVFWFTGKRP